MKAHYLLIPYLLIINILGAEQVAFTPPKGWQFADQAHLTEKVKVLVVGPKRNHYPPSINLGYEHYEGTMEEYLAFAKAINLAMKAEWRDLGTIETQAGTARLTQIDTATEWGDVRMMHVMLLRDQTMIVLTAAALKAEYPDYYQILFESLKSLRIEEKG